MGCGTSRVKPARCPSQVTMESHQRTVAAYRRQRIARDMEQDAYLRAEAEVEKALMLKRCSVDERRPSYIQRVLEDLAEVEEGQEETEEEQNPVITIDAASEVNLKRDYSNENLIGHTMYSSTEHASDEDDERNRKLSVPIQDDVEILTENPNSESAFHNDGKELGESCTNNMSEEYFDRDEKRELNENEENYEGNVTIDLTENVMQNSLVATNEESNSLDIKPEVHIELDQRSSENEKVGNENRINENLEQKTQEPEEEALTGNATQPTSNDALDLNTTNSFNETTELEVKP